MKRPTIPSDDIANALALEERARNRMATNQENGPRSWFDRQLDVPTFLLAVIGGVVSIAVFAAFLYPLALTSYRFWVS